VIVLLNPWLSKLERKKKAAYSKDKDAKTVEFKWMAKRHIPGNLPPDESFYTLDITTHLLAPKNSQVMPLH